MEQFMVEINKLLNVVLGNPADDVEKFGLTLIAVITLIVAMGGIGSLLGITMANMKSSMVVSFLSVLIIMGAAAATRIYAPDYIKDPMIVTWLPLVVAVALLLIVTVPLMMLIQKARYMNGLFCLVLSLATVTVLVLLGQAAFGAFSAGNTEMDSTRKHKQELNEMLK